MQPIVGWSGDLPGIERWVRDLMPRLPAAADSVFPQTIEFYVGQQNPVRQEESVSCGDVEGDDLLTKVRAVLAKVLASLPKDKTMVSLTIRATRIDKEGTEVPWGEAGEVVRQMTRVVAAASHLPPPPPAAPRAPPKIPPPPKPEDDDWMAPPEEDEAEGDEPEEEEEEGEEEARLPRPKKEKRGMSHRARLEAYAQDPVMRRRRRKARMSAIDIVVTTLREENADFRSQQRYLIEQMVGSHERALEVIGEALKERTGEIREARTDANALQKDYIKVERDRAKGEKEAAIAGVKEQLKAEQRVSEAHKAGRAELIRLAEKMSRRGSSSEGGGGTKPQSAADRAGDRAVGLAEKVAERVIMGALDEGGGKKEGGGGGDGGGGGGMDPSKMTPEEMGGVLAFLSPEARKRALLALAKQNPGLAQSLAGEVVEALDQTVGPGNWGQDGDDDDTGDDDDDDAEGGDDDE